MPIARKPTGKIRTGKAKCHRQHHRHRHRVRWGDEPKSGQTESPQGAVSPPTDSMQPQEISPTDQSTEQPVGEVATRIVTTVMGDVEIPAHPTRIALTYHDDIDHLIALGVNPIAVPTYERTGHIDGYLPFLVEELKGVEKIGNVPSMEAVLSVEPDLIIAGYSHREVIADFYPPWHGSLPLVSLLTGFHAAIFEDRGEKASFTWKICS